MIPDLPPSLQLELAALVTFDWRLPEGMVCLGGEGAGPLGFRSGTLAELLERVHPDDRAQLEATLEAASLGGGDRQIELRWLGEKGPGPELAGRVRRLEGEGEDAARVVGVLWDVSASRARERRLAEQELLVRTLFMRAPVPMGVSDEEGRLLIFNDAIATSGGYTREDVEALGSVAELYWDPEERDAMVERVRTEGQVEAAEVRFKRRDGTAFLGSLSLVPIEVEARRLLLASVEDITERRALEEQLLRAQKLEAVGRLAGGIAHDFNNLITVILGYASFMDEALGPADALRGSVDQIVSAGERAAELTRQLLAFARRQMVQPKVLVLGDVLGGLDSMLRRLIGEDIELETRVAPGLWPVSIDPGQLEQVIVNLAVNSRDAMPRGGRLLIETQNVAVGPDQPYQPAMVDGPYVRLAITDTGEGMSVDTQMRLFEPFFSTKELGKGSGLGLATCYGIVKQAGGYIWVESEPDRGTTFEIYLPKAEGAAEGSTRESEVERVGPEGRAECILLVEDDPQVNELSARTLRSRGYVVHVARTGEEALEVASGLDGLDLLITDVVLPKLSGDEVAARLLAVRPDLLVLYMSGYTDSDAVRRALDGGGFFLQKPFTPDRLATKVRTTLDAGL